VNSKNQDFENGLDIKQQDAFAQNKVIQNQQIN